MRTFLAQFREVESNDQETNVSEKLGDADPHGVRENGRTGAGKYRESILHNADEAT